MRRANAGAALSLPSGKPGDEITTADLRPGSVLSRTLPSSGSPASFEFGGRIFGLKSVEIVDRAGGRIGAIDFAAPATSHPDQAITPRDGNAFATDFQQEVERLKKWAKDCAWPACRLPELQVLVSDRFHISKSLVPGWFGRHGYMEFPLWRVAAHKAAIMHELVHIFFPNGNRFLAEGLAVFVQALIGNNPAFPNFGVPLHRRVRETLREATAPGWAEETPILQSFHLAELDSIATPRPLTLRVGPWIYGEDKRGQAFIYPIAGSFVQFLIEKHGMKNFQSLYLWTPMVPLVSDAGARHRWSEVYGVALETLETEWKAMIEGSQNESKLVSA